jgi:hypothetical protein
MKVELNQSRHPRLPNPQTLAGREPRKNMPRKWLRLVACLSLAVYLFGNTPASLAISIHLQSVPPLVEQEPQSSSPNGPSDDVSSCCKHCAKLRGKVTAEPHSEGPEHGSDHSSCPSCPEGPMDSSCPCCPKGPPCPLPGGCALCSVAKVPCLAAPLLTMLPLLCAGASLTESPPLYVSPLGGDLIRPPRL